MFIRQLARTLVLALFAALIAFGADAPATASQALPADDGPRLPPWLSLGFEIRGRVEALTSPSFVAGTSASHFLSRLRADTDARLTPWLRFHARVQDSRAGGWDGPAKPASVENTFEIGEASVSIGSEEDPGWSATAGRQPLVFGAMRVLSTSNWGNVGPRWDGFRVVRRAEGLRLDFFGAAPVGPVSGELDRWFAPGRRAFGVYGNIGRIPGIDTVEPYVIGFTYEPAIGETGNIGERRFAVLGTRVVDRLTPHIDIELEITGQFGEWGGDSLRAWGAVAEVGYRPVVGAKAPRLFGRHQFATGDDHPADNRAGGFQQMYATDKWGTPDNIAWRNIHESVFGLGWTPSQRLTILVQGRTFRLASRADGLYSTGGTVMAFQPGASSGHVGEEADFRIVWQAQSALQLYGGYGYFSPGRFLEEATPGAGRHLAYLMWTLRL